MPNRETSIQPAKFQDAGVIMSRGDRRRRDTIVLVRAD
jgi:hypothetical protein